MDGFPIGTVEITSHAAAAFARAGVDAGGYLDKYLWATGTRTARHMATILLPSALLGSACYWWRMSRR